MPKGKNFFDEQDKELFRLFTRGLDFRPFYGAAEAARQEGLTVAFYADPAGIIECTDYREVTDDAERLQLPAPVSPHQ